MKSTTRLYDVIKSSFITYKNDNRGADELLSYTHFNDNFMLELASQSQTMYNVLMFTVYQGIGNVISNETVAKEFIFEFTQRFITRSIKFQTLDLFRLHLLAECKARESIINAVYGPDKNNYIQGNETTHVISDGSDENKGNTTSSSLPQAMTSIDNVDFADSLDQSQNSGKSHTEQKSTNSSFGVKTVQDFTNMKEQLFVQLDTKLFSQIY